MPIQEYFKRHSMLWRLAMVGSLVLVTAVLVLIITKLTAPTIAPVLTNSTADLPPTETVVTSAINLPNPGFEHALDNWTAGLRLPDKPVSNDGYHIAIDQATHYAGKAAARLESIEKQPSIFGAITSKLEVDQVKGRRIRYSAYMKSENTVGWAGLYMYVYRVLPGGTVLDKVPMSWDQMFDRRIEGTTDWQQYEIVLDVPLEASLITFGAELSGLGKVWLDDVQIETVGDDVPSTDRGGSKKLPTLDFESGLADWISYTVMTTAETDVYTTGIGAEMAHTGKLGAYIRSTGSPRSDQYAVLSSSIIYAGYYQGKTVHISAYINADKVKDHASLWLVSPTKDAQGRTIAVPSETLIPGTAINQSHWQKYEVSIHIPNDAPNFIFELRLFGEGEVWIDDVQVAIVN